MFYEDQHKLAAYLERTGAEFEYTNLETAPLGNESVWLKPHTSADSYVNHPLSRFFIRPVLRYNLPSHLQSEIHNPDNMTEEQICEGGKYRAVLKSESAKQTHECFDRYSEEWEEAIQGVSPFAGYGRTYRLLATVPWPDWDQDDGIQVLPAGQTIESFAASQPDPKDARIAELEAYIHTIRPKADCYDRVCQTLDIESDIIGHVKRLEAQLTTSPWRPMSEAPTEEDADEEGRILTFFLGKASSCVIHYTALNSRYHTAWMPVPKFHGWPDPLADLLKAHGVAVTPEILAAFNAWKGVEK